MSFSRGVFQILKCVPSFATRRTVSTTACVYNGITARWKAPLHRELYHRHNKMKKLNKLPTNIRSEYIEWNYDSELYAFGRRLQEEFDESLLRRALTDLSYVERETRQQVALGVDAPALQMSSNCELSATGKAIIRDYSRKFLRASLPLLPEEGIRIISEYLTSLEVMSDVGLGIGLKDIILAEEHPPSPATVAKAFEAVVETLNISSGLEHCQRFIKDFVMTQLVGKDIYDIWQIDEPVNVLTNILTRSGQGKPEPRLVFQSGIKTLEAVYQVAVYSDKQFIGTGYGESVAVAMEQAAWDALRRLFQTTASSDPLPLGQLGEEIEMSDRENVSLNDWSTDKVKTIVMC